MIHISTKWEPATGKAFYVGRGSALGNPFRMYDESQRNEVCDKFNAYLRQKIAEHDRDILTALRTLHSHILLFGEVTLQCYCAPRRCHAESIKNVLEDQELMFKILERNK